MIPIGYQSSTKPEELFECSRIRANVLLLRISRCCVVRGRLSVALIGLVRTS
jgi:hypothetical protein